MSVTFPQSIRGWRLPVATGLGLLLLAGDAAALSNLAQCRLDTADGALEMMRARHRRDRECLKDGVYCASLPGSADDDLQLALTGVDSACVAATVLDGVDPDELSPEPCSSSWLDCDDSWDDLQSVYDVWQCHRCMARGRDRKFKFDFEVAPIFGATEDETRCVSKLYGSIGRAAERGARDAISCAGHAGEPPWNCTTAVVPGSGYEKALGRIERTATKCEDQLDATAGVLAQLCHRPLESVASLAECAQSMARCRACQFASATLGLTQDCVAQSGDRLCDAARSSEYGRPGIGTTLVTNRGDDSITMFDWQAEYLFGDLPLSTFPTGGGPADIALRDVLALAFTANADDDTVTYLDSGTGQPAFGSLLASTFAVGSHPSALAVHSRGILYVANEDDGTVTFLDAAAGGYVFGSLASSTFPTGAGPSSLAVDETRGILYVANSDDDTVTFLDALTGAPFLGTLAASTFPAGDEPRSLAIGSYLDVLFVTSHGAGSVLQLDPVSGAPAYGTVPDSTYAVGSGAVSSISLGSGALTVAREGEQITVYSYFAMETIDGYVNLDSIDLGAQASDVAISDGYYGRALVTLESDDLLAAVPFGSFEAALGYSAIENAKIDAGSSTETPAVNPTTGEYYVGTYFDDAIFAAVDPVTRAVAPRGALSHGYIVAYNPATGILFVTDPGRDYLLLVDAATGALAGTTPTICTEIESLTLAPASNTLFVRCEVSIVYLDATTGDFRTGSAATSTLDLDGWGTDVVLDESEDRAYAERYYFSDSSVVALTISSVGYAGGTLPASHLLSGSGGRGLEIDPVANVLYRGYVSGEVKLFDTTGMQLGTSALTADSLDDVRLSYNPANGLLYVSRSDAYPPGVTREIDDVVYLHASDGSFLHTSLEDSSVRIGASRDLSKAVVSAVGGTIAVAQRYDWRMVLLDPDEPLPLGEPSAYRDAKPTGDAPSAVATVGYVY